MRTAPAAALLPDLYSVLIVSRGRTMRPAMVFPAGGRCRTRIRGRSVTTICVEIYFKLGSELEINLDARVIANHDGSN